MKFLSDFNILVALSPMVLFETDNVFMMKTIQCWPTEQHSLLCDQVPYKLSSSCDCGCLHQSFCHSPQISTFFIRVFPLLKAGAVQLSVISNFSIDCSTKTTFSLFNSKEKQIQQRFHSSPKKAKSLFNQFPCLLFLYL